VPLPRRPAGPRKTRYFLWIAAGLLGALLGCSFAAQDIARVKVEVKDYADFSRVILESSQTLITHIARKTAGSIEVSIDSANPVHIQSAPVSSRLIRSVSLTRQGSRHTLSIEAKTESFNFHSYTVDNPFQLILDFREAGGQTEVTSPRPEEAKPSPPAEVKPSLPPPQDIRQPSAVPSSGSRTIVIDPGHGGMESGAKGKFGTLEKDITLAISLKLKSIIERNLAFRVVLTRDKDVEVGLADRAAEANNNNALLFISIHANGSYQKSSRGSETFFLNLNATDEDVRRLAYFENTQTELEARIAAGQEYQDDIKMILWDMAQAAFIRQSSRLAELVQAQLNSLLGTANRGIKQAPFKVLTEVACPAILVEVAFLSNPEEERELGREEFQWNVAQAIYQGLVNAIREFPAQDTRR
jgi:N-acetylmuramoyl-L-alanine amidase